MKERAEEVQKNTFIYVGLVFFVVLSVVTVFNTYKVAKLEAEILELRDNIEKLMYEKSNKIPLVLYRHLRERRNRNLVEKLNRDTNGDTATNNIAHTIVKKSASSSMESYVNDNNDGNLDSEFPIIRDEGVITRSRMQVLDERHPKTGRIKPLPSIHFGGDTSTYVLGTHENFNGNGHLRHLNSIFVDWKPSKWVQRTGMINHFQFEDGYLTIKEPGLYLIYSQIYYLDDHDLNGYRVFKNDEMILQCTVQVHSDVRARKGNTCYTAGVEYLAERDKISLGDIFKDHYSMFVPGMSFFGAVKLGDIRAII